MTLAAIFRPIRHQPAVDEPGAGRESRAGVQPVTNTPSPGAPSGPSTRSAQEEGWLALLELVFDETGWPDADAE
jgi:hypothetical protein